MGLNAVVLAAGRGTRMKSEKLKIAHPIAGKPIILHVIENISKLDLDHIFIVVGHQQDIVKETLNGFHDHITYVEQFEQLGTGHAVLQVEPFFRDINGDVLVLNGDCPLITPQTLSNLWKIHQESNASATILTAEFPDPSGYGRIVRGMMGTVTKIVEHKDAAKSELDIREINTGIYCFRTRDLFATLKEVNPDNAQKEYYLTDIIRLMKDKRLPVEGVKAHDYLEVLGINTRMDISHVTEIIYQNNARLLMEDGVTIIDPKTTFIDSTVQIGADTTIYPFTMIMGDSRIGKHCTIGPNSVLKNAAIPDNTEVKPFENFAASP